jgi:hypothetical protein
VIVTSVTLKSTLPAYADSFFGSLACSPTAGVSGGAFISAFETFLCFSQFEAIPAVVLWYTVSYLHLTLNPVPPSTFARGVFPSMACGSCFHESAALAVSRSFDGLLAMKSLALSPNLNPDQCGLVPPSAVMGLRSILSP